MFQFGFKYPKLNGLYGNSQRKMNVTQIGKNHYKHTPVLSWYSTSKVGSNIRGASKEAL